MLEFSIPDLSNFEDLDLEVGPSGLRVSAEGFGTVILFNFVGVLTATDVVFA